MEQIGQIVRWHIEHKFLDDHNHWYRWSRYSDRAWAVAEIEKLRSSQKGPAHARLMFRLVKETTTIELEDV